MVSNQNQQDYEEPHLSDDDVEWDGRRWVDRRACAPNADAVWSLRCGTFAFVMSLSLPATVLIFGSMFPFLGAFALAAPAIAGLAAIGLGAIGWWRAAQGQTWDGKGAAVTGIVLGIGAIAVEILFIWVIAAIIHHGSFP